MGERAAAALIALTLFLAPAIGATTDELLQDTLKSAVVALGVLLAALAFCWNRRQPMRWHPVLLLPLMLMAYALGSMAWSHPYLAGVEAVRWFVFSLLACLCINVATRDRRHVLAWGVLAGAAVASVWAVLQFLFGFDLFPQAAAPGSTFINRNFFAEFVVCTIPFAGFLARGRPWLVATIAGLEIAALFMAGTRSALLALLVVAPWVAWRLRGASVLAAAIVLALGLLPGVDGSTALARATARTASISPADPSMSIRYGMWGATAKMIGAHPVAGVGAGAWENVVPWFQPPAAPVETDYYVHNEFLQLVSEYGVAGWVFLIVLVAWLARTVMRARDEWAIALVSSMGALFIVSCAGFSWHLAATGALFALCLGSLAAAQARTVPFKLPRLVPVSTVAVSLGVASYITWLAIEAESNLLGAAKLSLSPSADRQQILSRMKEGIAVNPHYRKVTPLIADQLARQGDWQDALWIWESVLASRPNVVAILTNTARGYIATNRPQQALPYLERARRIQPDAPSVRSAEVLLLVSLGRNAEALKKGREALAQGISDADLQRAVKVLGELDVRQ